MPPRSGGARRSAISGTIDVASPDDAISFPNPQTGSFLALPDALVDAVLGSVDCVDQSRTAAVLALTCKDFQKTRAIKVRLLEGEIRSLTPADGHESDRLSALVTRTSRDPHMRPTGALAGVLHHVLRSESGTAIATGILNIVQRLPRQEREFVLLPFIASGIRATQRRQGTTVLLTDPPVRVALFDQVLTQLPALPTDHRGEIVKALARGVKRLDARAHPEFFERFTQIAASSPVEASADALAAMIAALPAHAPHHLLVDLPEYFRKIASLPKNVQAAPLVAFLRKVRALDELENRDTRRAVNGLKNAAFASIQKLAVDDRRAPLIAYVRAIRTADAASEFDRVISAAANITPTALPHFARAVGRKLIPRPDDVRRTYWNRLAALDVHLGSANRSEYIRVLQEQIFHLPVADRTAAHDRLLARVSTLEDAHLADALVAVTRGTVARFPTNIPAEQIGEPSRRQFEPVFETLFEHVQRTPDASTLSALAITTQYLLPETVETKIDRIWQSTGAEDICDAMVRLETETQRKYSVANAVPTASRSKYLARLVTELL